VAHFGLASQANGYQYLNGSNIFITTFSTCSFWKSSVPWGVWIVFIFLQVF